MCSPDLDLFMGDPDLMDEFPDGADWDVTFTWVRKVPREWGYNYVYANGPGPGARACVRVELAFVTNHWCVNHPFEPGNTGIPVEQVLNPPWPKVLAHIVAPERRRPESRWPQDGDAYVYLCRDCCASFSARRAAARAEALADLRREE